MIVESLINLAVVIGIMGLVALFAVVIVFSIQVGRELFDDDDEWG